MPVQDRPHAHLPRRRKRNWTVDFDETQSAARGRNREAQLVAIFDMLVRRDDVEACSFINPLLEVGGVHPLGRASSVCRANVLVWRSAAWSVDGAVPAGSHAWSVTLGGGRTRQLVRVVADTP